MRMPHNSGNSGNSIHDHIHPHVLFPLFVKVTLWIVIFFPENIFIQSFAKLHELVDHPSSNILSITLWLYPLISNIISSSVLLDISTVPDPTRILHPEK